MTKDTAKSKLEYPSTLTPVDVKLLFKDLYATINELQNEVRRLSTDRPKGSRASREDLPPARL